MERDAAKGSEVVPFAVDDELDKGLELPEDEAEGLELPEDEAESVADAVLKPWWEEEGLADEVILVVKD